MKKKIMQMPTWIVVVIGILVAAGFIALLNLNEFVYRILPELPGYGMQMVGELIGGIYALVVLLLFGYGKTLKEKGAGFVRAFYIGGFMVGYCFYVLAAQCYLQAMTPDKHLEPLVNILMFIATMFLIGWTEELIFRGTILNLFLERFSKTKKGILGAIILSGVVFGGIHMFNIFSGVSVPSAIIQSINAAVLGILFGAIYVRSGNIWVVIAAHAVTDLAALLGSGFFGSGTVVDGINNITPMNLLGTVILIIPCIVLLMGSKLAEMEQRANGRVVFDTYEEADAMATTSLIVSIIGGLMDFMGFGIGMSIVGLLGSYISKKIKPAQNGIATAAMIISIIGIVIGVIMCVLMCVIYSMVNSVMPELMEMLY